MDRSQSIIVVTGDKELIAAMGQVADKVKNTIARKVMLTEAKRFLPMSRALVPVRTMLLKRSLTTSVSVKPRKGLVRVSYGPRKERTVQDMDTGAYGIFRGRMPKAARAKYKIIIDPVRYAHLVEFGTKSHKVTAHGPYLLRDKKTGRAFGHSVTIKAKSKPFMLPVFQQNKDSAMTNIIRNSKAMIEQEVRNAAASSR